MAEFELEQISLHGHEVAFRRGGSGPVVVLLHGMAGSASTWRHVMPRLAEEYTVIAPDLMGHGTSDKPRGDYSLGAYASAVRDLLAYLGHDRFTVVGQSFGGGVALQFTYQFPERCERLVLVSSGGLGKRVSPVLRALAAPGAEYVLPIACTTWAHGAGVALARAAGRVGFTPSAHLEEVWRSYGSLAEPETRAAFVDTLRSVVSPSGQRVSAHDKLYLSSAMPTLIVWGDRDAIIPVEQAYAAHEAMPGSRLEIFEGASHYPHCDQPERFVDVLTEFLRTTEPADGSDMDWGGMLQAAGS